MPLERTMSVLSKPYFHDEAAAFAHLEAVIWGGTPVCPHCGARDRISAIAPNEAKRVRMGLKKCGRCKKQFTVKVGTVFEHARMPLHKMLQAMYLMTTSKKGVSAHQLHRTLEVTYKTAWFLAHRIRGTMRTTDLSTFGVGGGSVEVDETFIGRLKGAPVKRSFHYKMKVLALVDRPTGRASTMVVDDVKAATLMRIVRANVAKEATIMTDKHLAYTRIKDHFSGHGTTVHSSGQYVDFNDATIHSTTVEGYLSIFKRGMKGVYQHCGEAHLHRYLAEFEFRYNYRVRNGYDDGARTVETIKGIVGKRLLYADSFAA